MFGGSLPQQRSSMSSSAGHHLYYLLYEDPLSPVASASQWKNSSLSVDVLVMSYLSLLG